MRSGAYALRLLASPVTGPILNALADGPKKQVELRRAAGSPAQTTLRSEVKKLERIDVISRKRRDRFPGAIDHELTPVGCELLKVAAMLQRWLERRPDGPLAFSSAAAKAAINALTAGWSTTMLRALAAKPLTLTELDSLIGSLNYPSLERRLAAMKLAGQLEARRGNGRGTPYGVTVWTREAVGPLAAAARWERRHLPHETAPISPVDTEAAFLLAMPLLRLPADASGSCRMAADIGNGSGRRTAGVMVEVRKGAIVSCTTRLSGTPDGWAWGSPATWLTAVIDADTDGLELGGDGRLALMLLNGLHVALSGKRSRTPAHRRDTPNEASDASALDAY